MCIFPTVQVRFPKFVNFISSMTPDKRWQEMEAVHGPSIQISALKSEPQQRDLRAISKSQMKSIQIQKYLTRCIMYFRGLLTPCFKEPRQYSYIGPKPCSGRQALESRLSANGETLYRVAYVAYDFSFLGGCRLWLRLRRFAVKASVMCRNWSDAPIKASSKGDGFNFEIL
jgi:hypothetical protein